MQTSGLVGTIRLLGAKGTEVAFINQPDLNAGQVGARHHAADKLMQQMLYRLLMGNIQKQLGGKIRIVSAVSI
jgi:hypothetical protein